MNPQVFAIITLAFAAFFTGWLSHWAFAETKKYKELQKKHPLPKYPKAYKS